MTTNSAQITLYALDTHASSSVVDVFINQEKRGTIKVGNHQTYDIEPGKLEVYVEIKMGLAPNRSDPIVIDEVNSGEHPVFFAGSKISATKMGIDAASGYAIGELFGLVGTILTASKSSYQGNEQITFGQLKPDEDIETILELARLQKRRTMLRSVIGLPVIGLVFLAGGVFISLSEQDPRIALFSSGIALFFFVLAYGAYRQLPAKDVPS